MYRLCRRAMGASRGLRLYLLSLPKNFDPRRPNKKSWKPTDRGGHRERMEPELSEPEP
jgi:hypothetical protein